MERLDRKEYRCTHCGAITVISDDDADRVEEMLRAALERQSSRPARPTPNAAPPRAVGVLILVVVVIAVGIPLIAGLIASQSVKSPPTVLSSFGRDTVPASQVTLSPLTYNKERHRYEGTIYNHSGYAIHTPRFNMTLFTNGHRTGSTWSSTPLSRLLPGEYEPISFDLITFFNSPVPDRYELDPLDSVARDTDEVARPALTQQQLVRQEGQDWVQLVGVVRNTFTRPIERPSVLLVLYGPNHEVLGSDNVYLEDLRPGEDGLVDMKVYPHPEGATVASYEYIVDATFKRSGR